MKFIKFAKFAIILVCTLISFISNDKNLKEQRNYVLKFNKKTTHDLDNKINCNDICNSHYSKDICNLGILAGENDKLGSYRNLTCSCISNKLRGDEQTLVNKHIHLEWCFDVFGCYESNSGKCLTK